MQPYIQKTSLRLNHDILSTINLIQGDDARELHFYIDDYIIPDDAELRVYIKKPSGLEIYNPCIVENNEIIVSTTPQMTAEPGMSLGQIQIIKARAVLTTFTFRLMVSESLVYTTSITSSNEFTVLDDLIYQAQQEIQRANSAAQNATSAYQNANSAAQSANSAAQSATSAYQNANSAAQNATKTVNDLKTNFNGWFENTKDSLLTYYEGAALQEQTNVLKTTVLQLSEKVNMLKNSKVLWSGVCTSNSNISFNIPRTYFHNDGNTVTLIIEGYSDSKTIGDMTAMISINTSSKGFPLPSPTPRGYYLAYTEMSDLNRKNNTEELIEIRVSPSNDTNYLNCYVLLGLAHNTNTYISCISAYIPEDN